MKIAIISLGCPKNQVDADVFCHALIKDGHTTVADPAEADIIIINTCGFIESAKTEAIENILMACQYKQENPNLKVIVTGCLAERYKQQIIQEIPEVPGLVLACGFSGHGFAIGPAVGKIVTQIVMGEPTSVDVSALDYERFKPTGV